MLFTAEWETLCDLAVLALKQQKELEELENECCTLRQNQKKV